MKLVNQQVKLLDRYVKPDTALHFTFAVNFELSAPESTLVAKIAENGGSFNWADLTEVEANLATGIINVSGDAVLNLAYNGVEKVAYLHKEWAGNCSRFRVTRWWHDMKPGDPAPMALYVEICDQYPGISSRHQKNLVVIIPPNSFDGQHVHSSSTVTQYLAKRVFPQLEQLARYNKGENLF